MDSPRAWIVVAATFLATFTVFGVVYSFGAFFSSMADDFGTGKGATAFMFSITTAWYNQMGPSGWQQYHALGTDMTHTNAAGASKIAGFVEAAIKSQNIGLAKYLR